MSSQHSAPSFPQQLVITVPGIRMFGLARPASNDLLQGDNGEIDLPQTNQGRSHSAKYFGRETIYKAIA